MQNAPSLQAQHVSKPTHPGKTAMKISGPGQHPCPRPLSAVSCLSATLLKRHEHGYAHNRLDHCDDLEEGMTA